MKPRQNKPYFFYSVYLREDDTLLAHGTRAQCANALGMTENTFTTIVSKNKSGKHKKYEIHTEPYIEDEDYLPLLDMTEKPKQQESKPEKFKPVTVDPCLKCASKKYCFNMDGICPAARSYFLHTWDSSLADARKRNWIEVGA